MPVAERSTPNAARFNSVSLCGRSKTRRCSRPLLVMRRGRARPPPVPAHTLSRAGAGGSYRAASALARCRFVGILRLAMRTAVATGLDSDLLICKARHGSASPPRHGSDPSGRGPPVSAGSVSATAARCAVAAAPPQLGLGWS